MSGVQDRVVIVTGAGGGLGRAYAHHLAEHGACVVVNDLGGARDGSGAASEMSDQVVSEIRSAGGRAIANYASVATSEGAEDIVSSALTAFGAVHGVVSNAGILRDSSFHKMTAEGWDAVLQVHLYGGFNVIRAAWPHLRDQSFGRVVVTTSTSGLDGRFGQANYGAAKAGLVGLVSTLAIEGAKYGITANAVAPLAATRMTADIASPEVLEKLKPELVAPAVTYLMSTQSTDSGSVFIVGGGAFQRAAVYSNEGIQLDHVASLDEITARWTEITDMSSATARSRS